MTVLWLDTETKSRCDLKTRGSYNYARDPSTELLCLSYAFDDEDVCTWVPGQPFPEDVAAHFQNGGQIRVHNASFDRLILWYVVCPDFDVPAPKLEQFYCTAAQARANCAPGSLEDVGRFASANMKKDHRGAQLIRLLSIPQADGKFREDAELMAEMVRYCEQDVRAMRAVSKAMRDLSAEELADYHVNERINDRGLLVDRALCRAATKYAREEIVEIQDLVAAITNGAVRTVRSPNMKEWVLARVGDQARKLMTVFKDGEKKYSIDKTIRANLLALADEDKDEISADVAEVIQCTDDLWSSSVAKFVKLDSLADEEDDRVRGAFVFAGGSATGRASSYGAQVHNLPRMCAKDPEAVRQALVRGHDIIPKYGDRVTDVLKGMLRPSIMAAPGESLITYDWSAIEARVNPWLSGHGDATLQMFRDGKDIYVATAARMFGIPEESVTPEQRQLGKVAILACGFAGGVGAFAAMGRIYKVYLPEADAQRIVNLWRRTNAWAVPFWTAIETAYTRAMRNKGYEFSAGKVAYLFDGQHLWYALPSGRILCYPYARLEPDGITYAKASWKPAADAKEWPRGRLWRGLACENITQAAANDILRNTLRRLDAEGLRCIGHVHDEVLVACKDSEAEQVATRVKAIMCEAPAWAEGLPLNAEGKILKRFGK